MYSEMAQISQVLPKLIPDAINASCFNQWLCQFEVELALMAARAGKTQGPNPVDVYDDRVKLLSLLSAIGPAGISALRATGYDTNDPSNTFSDALVKLRAIYDRRESLYNSLQRFLLAKQEIGEDGLNYLLRVEKYSRCAGFDAPLADSALPEANATMLEDMRKLLICQRKDHSPIASVVPVNGLANQSLRSSLMACENLMWDILHNRVCVAETVDMDRLTQGKVDMPSLKSK